MGGAACAKIIRNGLIISAVVNDLVAEARDSIKTGDYLVNSDQIVVYLNQMEDMAFKAQRLLLEGQGHKGPWSHALDVKA